MNKKTDNEKQDEYSSLYDVFQPGDRVYRKMIVDKHKIKEYEGIIMAMDAENMEIYWDTIDGEYNPNIIDDDFTLCSIDEALNGNEEFSPIKRKRKSFIDELIKN